MFRDRIDAGRRLAERLGEYRGAEDAVVLGVPRGGVEVAAVIAEELDLPLDVVVVRKIGAPGNPEFAAGSVDERGEVFANPMAGAPEEYLRREGARQQQEIVRRLERFRKGRPGVDLRGKRALIVDDGIATGQTMLAAVASVRGQGAARVIVAAPVVAPDSGRRIRDAADELVDLAEPEYFSAVGQFYDIFNQTEDDEVERLLDRAHRMHPVG